VPEPVEEMTVSVVDETLPVTLRLARFVIVAVRRVVKNSNVLGPSVMRRSRPR